MTYSYLIYQLCGNNAASSSKPIACANSTRASALMGMLNQFQTRCPNRRDSKNATNVAVFSASHWRAGYTAYSDGPLGRR